MHVRPVCVGGELVVGMLRPCSRQGGNKLGRIRASRWLRWRHPVRQCAVWRLMRSAAMVAGADLVLGVFADI